MYKQLCGCLLLLTLVICFTSLVGCANKKPNNEFDYGITVNVPENWKAETYKFTAEENPAPLSAAYDYLGYPALYRVHCDYLKGGETYSLFSIYVFNAIDWNDMQFATGDGIGFGQAVEENGGFAYVISDLPQENPFGDDESGAEFNAMTEYVTGNYTWDYSACFTIGETDKKPTVTESRNSTIAADYAYFTLHIPAGWKYNELEITSGMDGAAYQWFSDSKKYDAVYMVRYALKAGQGETAELFSAYIFSNDIWEQIEADAEGGPTGIYRVASSGGYSLGVVTPQDNPLGGDSEIGKRFDEMLKSVCDFNAFFKLN